MSQLPSCISRETRTSVEYEAVRHALRDVKSRGVVLSHVARAAVARAARRAGDDRVAKTKIEKALIKAVHSMRVNLAKWAAAETIDDMQAADAIAAMDVALAAAALRLTRPGKPCDVDELAAKFAAELVEVAERKEMRAAEAQQRREEGYVLTVTYNKINAAGEPYEYTRTVEYTAEQVRSKKRLDRERKDQPLKERNPEKYASWTAAPGTTLIRDKFGTGSHAINSPKLVIKQEDLIQLHRDATFSVVLKHAARKVDTIYFLTREEAVEHLAELRRQGVLPPARQPPTLPKFLSYRRIRGVLRNYQFQLPSSYGGVTKIHKKLTKLKIKGFYYFPPTDAGLEAAKTFKKAMLAWLEGPKTTPPPSPP